MNKLVKEDASNQYNDYLSKGPKTSHHQNKSRYANNTKSQLKRRYKGKSSLCLVQTLSNENSTREQMKLIAALFEILSQDKL